MRTEELRQTFLEYFAKKEHTIVPSSSLVPKNDKTLLFTNAGMVQFKDVFLGLDKRPYFRATSCQRCLRAGGKHNDLENVGYTARHHTFFEMLGNFSFGDYFKREAIHYAWEFLTTILKLPKEKLWVTVFEDDDEAAEIWLKDIKVDKHRFSRCGEKDNFWAMGDTGPCGPSSEIFYDHGPHIAGGPPGSPDAEGDRYIEIWNLVFMQYERSEDGSLSPLPKPSVDTGMGFERIAAIMQGVHSNYEIDIFQYLIKTIAQRAHVTDLQHTSLKVIADHIRACAFLIVDGVLPSNEGRGYVLRRICRRAIRHGFRLGFTEPFFFDLVKPLADMMGSAYPELINGMHHVERVLHQEELQFARTLEHGMHILEEDIAKLSTGGVISGDTVFRLYDTYGFPVDLTADIARERNLQIDLVGFDAAMEQQRTRAREASQFAADYSERLDLPFHTKFIGYESLEAQGKVLALFKDQEPHPIAELKKGDPGKVVLDTISFYAESGGQVGDVGRLVSANGEFEVKNTRKIGQAFVHEGIMVRGTLETDAIVEAYVDAEKRRATALNHSATHLLHAALRKVLGSHVQQKGSLVEPSRLRFDFSHLQALRPQELQAVEDLVNEQIRVNSEVKTEILSVEEALNSGAMALFGEKYGEKVRVLKMGNDFSVELCGGTHVSRTGNIGFFKIISETGVASGIRRIEAETGEFALNSIKEIEKTLNILAETLKCGNQPALLLEKVTQLLNKNRALEKDLNVAKHALLKGGSGSSIAEHAKDIKGVKVLAEEVLALDMQSLRDMLDQLKDKLKSAVIILATVKEDKVNLVAGVTKDCSIKVPATALVNFVANQVGGQGGGRPEMAQAGGTDPRHLKESLAAVYDWVEERL